MNVELIPAALAGYLIWKGWENYSSPAPPAEALADTYVSEYSLVYINPTPVS